MRYRQGEKRKGDEDELEDAPDSNKSDWSVLMVGSLATQDVNDEPGTARLAEKFGKIGPKSNSIRPWSGQPDGRKSSS